MSMVIGSRGSRVLGDFILECRGLYILMARGVRV